MDLSQEYGNFNGDNEVSNHQICVDAVSMVSSSWISRFSGGQFLPTDLTNPTAARILNG